VIPEDEELDNSDVFFVVSMFFIGLAIVVISGLSGVFLGFVPGVLIMAFAVYYRRRLLCSRGGA
jgi:hypothetical protein